MLFYKEVVVMEAISQISNQSSVVSASLGSPLSTSLPSSSQQQVSVQVAAGDLSQPLNDRAVKSAVHQVNQTLQMQGSDRSVSFGYEEKLGQMFVQIHDARTGSVVGEFPSKGQRALQIAMNEMVGLILDKKG